MFNSIRKKIVAGFSIILIIISATTIYNVYSFRESREHIMHIKNEAAKDLELSNSMENDIVQVRLYLADVSASKKSDDLKKAEEHAQAFKNNSSELLKVNDSLKASVDELNAAFDKFYSFGKNMTDTYVNKGNDEGNKMMDEFDGLADDAYKKVDVIQKNSQQDMDDDLKTVDEHMMINENIGITIAIIAIFLSILIAIILGNGLRKPINNLVEIFIDLEKGEGDLTRRINIKSKDEIGKMAQAFNKFMDTMERMVIHIRKNSVVVSHGSDILQKGGIQTNEGISNISSNMNKVTDDTQKISSSISTITANISEIAKTSQSTAVDAQEICTSAGEINIIAQNSGKLALDTKLEMENIEKISSNTIGITEALGKEAEEIGKIIDTIKAITDQTNLLALNAAIEAARAGENGRGFGVVAEEIRKLAESNNQSAKMIEQLVKNIQDMIIQTIKATTDTGMNIKQGSKMVESVYTELQRIAEGVLLINNRIQSIATSTEEQSASTEELSATMEDINNSNTQIASSVQEIAAGISMQVETVTGLSATASELNESAEQLNNLVNKFKLRG